jgi:hypothetical protein
LVHFSFPLVTSCRKREEEAPNERMKMKMNDWSNDGQR